MGEEVQCNISVAYNNTLGNDTESNYLMAAGDQSGKATALVVTQSSPTFRKGDHSNIASMNVTRTRSFCLAAKSWISAL